METQDVEEEGSSSTPGKEDTEDGNVKNEGQAINVLVEQAEIPSIKPENQDPIEVEESTPERALEEESIPEWRMKFKSSLLQASAQQSPAFIKTLLDTSLHYDRLRRRSLIFR